MKKGPLTFMVMCLFLTGILFLSCQIEEPVSLADEEIRLTAASTAIEIARNFLISENAMVSNADWASRAEITKAYPMYLDGIEDPSYYDCKVTVDGKDAGYVIVNVNQTDIPVLEYSTEGITTSEQFSNETKISIRELKIYRYNNFEYIAEKRQKSTKSENPVLAELGFTNGGNIKTIDNENAEKIKTRRNRFRNNVMENNCAPKYTTEELKRIHQQNADADKLTKGTTRWTSDELNNTFTSGWHLPQWTQAKITINGSQYSVGCSPLAITMCYAYWKQFKGKTQLFGGANLNNYSYSSHSSSSVVLSAVREIAGDLGTTYNNGAGSTNMSVAREDDIDNYGDDRGYSFTCDVDYGGDWAKGQNAYSRIKNHDQPIAVSMNTEGNEASNHTVAIEGVKYKEYQALWTWYNREMWLLMNYGWGNKRVWVCTYNRYNNGAETETQGFYHFWD
ncbi:MAG: hypothetical protein JXR70_11725 [Spirochaetales bacterium]|nr:hypothetical protein [Spirochaetales bacterium]